MIQHVLITLLIGVAVGYLARKMKIPGGFLVGSLVGAAAYNIFFGAAYMPKESKTVIQIVAGGFIGCIMEKSDVQRLQKIIKPIVFMITALLVLNLGGGFLIWKSSTMDLLTSLMCIVPGGISDTPILAADMGADGPKVAVMQIIRQVLGIGVFPGLIMLYDKAKGAYDIEGRGYVEKRKKSKTHSTAACLCTLMVATVFGLIGKFSGIPSGTFMFAILSTMVLKLYFDFAYIPRPLKMFAQILSGSYLGSTICMADVMELQGMFIPLAIIFSGYALNCLITGSLIRRFCSFTRKESMLITTPAGASDMALISADLGVNNTDVVILQVVRAVVVMTFFPQLMYVIATHFN
ncbi:AbrB family transcriptional regulator [Desulfobulbus rhabdoformis]|uniref:AbrB family transcriptional regulator n=1 Tax=Desulfobulbus rhabdoformis TaxID=34032 RepID=UPI0019631ACF|nr:AbrB family transcriptional regulator [Desulfobulbus rhabdoformis]MBM9616368.1 AbrB family transcriptional regulator [Desulfobulbus rhabdoformis]